MLSTAALPPTHSFFSKIETLYPRAARTHAALGRQDPIRLLQPLNSSRCLFYATAAAAAAGVKDYLPGGSNAEILKHNLEPSCRFKNHR